MIYSIDSIYKEEDRVYVRAVIEDAVLAYPQTMDSPAEYKPAMCEASFSMTEDYTIPEEEEDLILYLQDLDLDWEVVDDY